MNISELSTTRDGFDFINVYSKGGTELGRDLSNFARFPFMHPKYGMFQSIEGLWFWLRSELVDYGWNEDDEANRTHLRELHGYEAKQWGSNLLKKVPKEAWNGFPEDTFREGIIDGTRVKLKSHHRLLKNFANSTLPLVHFYAYGKEGNEAIRHAGHQWLIEALEDIRKELHYDFAEGFVYRLKESSDTPREKWTVWVDKSDNRWHNKQVFEALIILCNRQVGKTVTDKAWEFFRAKIKEMEAMEDKHVDSFIQSHFFTKDTFKSIHDYSIVQHNGIVIRNFTE